VTSKTIFELFLKGKTILELLTRILAHVYIFFGLKNMT